MMTKRLTPFILAAVLALGAAPSVAETGSAGDVYIRMQKVNVNLKSYTAQLHVDVQTHSFPYISPTLDGTAYFKKPDKTAVVFDTVPALASQFKKVYPQIEPPSEWPQIYDVTPLSDDGANAAFRLVRKKNGRIDHVDVKVDDKTATVTSMTYFYKDNGGTVTLAQTYDQIDGNYVVKAQNGKVDIPHYNADISSTFSNYKLNVNVPDKVFEQ
ncbi:MAG: hypothetical protein ABR591_09015 [Candidatus Velthaea sp.]